MGTCTTQEGRSQLVMMESILVWTGIFVEIIMVNGLGLRKKTGPGPLPFYPLNTLLNILFLKTKTNIIKNSECRRVFFRKISINP